MIETITDNEDSHSRTSGAGHNQKLEHLQPELFKATVSDYNHILFRASIAPDFGTAEGTRGAYPPDRPAGERRTVTDATDRPPEAEPVISPESLG